MTARARRLLGLGLVALVVAVGALVATGWYRTRTPAAVATPQPSRIAVLGDTYSAGLDNTVVWPSLLAADTGASVTNVSVPAAGYLADAGRLGTLAAQVDRAAAARPDIVVVFGGLFDVGRPEPLVRRAASDLFAAVTAALPAARLIVVGPIWASLPPPESIRAIDRAVGGAAADLRVPYARLLDETWLTAPGLVRGGDSQPSDEGERRLATGIAEALRKQGVSLG